MHSLRMDAVDDESVQPTKVLLVEARPVPLLIEMRACLLRLEHLIWAPRENVSAPKKRDPTEKLCRQVFPVEAEHAFPHDCVVHT